RALYPRPEGRGFTVLWIKSFLLLVHQFSYSLIHKACKIAPLSSDYIYNTISLVFKKVFNASI
ncbi:hypothetical protein ACY18M_12375, partial [Proteus mirabilis]